MQKDPSLISAMAWRFIARFEANSVVVFLLICGLASLTPPCQAQPLIETVSSIDSLVINADYVYVGKIIKVRDDPIPGGSDSPGFTFEVEQYLKVPMDEELTPEIKVRGMFISPPTGKYKDWRDRDCRLLIIASDRNLDSPNVLELSPNRAEVFTADFRLLREPDKIIDAAKNAIERTSSNIRRVYTVRLMLPPEHYRGSRWEGGQGVMLEVPADLQLEKRALESLGHPNPWNRLHAVRSLRYFKSDRNAKSIKPLLDDPEASVRNAARGTLTRWGSLEGS